jgi:hypothetical protein
LGAVWAKAVTVKEAGWIDIPTHSPAIRIIVLLRIGVTPLEAVLEKLVEILRFA